MKKQKIVTLKPLVPDQSFSLYPTDAYMDIYFNEILICQGCSSIFKCDGRYYIEDIEILNDAGSEYIIQEHVEVWEYTACNACKMKAVLGNAKQLVKQSKRKLKVVNNRLHRNIAYVISTKKKYDNQRKKVKIIEKKLIAKYVKKKPKKNNL